MKVIAAITTWIVILSLLMLLPYSHTEQVPSDEYNTWEMIYFNHNGADRSGQMVGKVDIIQSDTSFIAYCKGQPVLDLRLRDDGWIRDVETRYIEHDLILSTDGIMVWLSSYEDEMIHFQKIYK